MATSTHNVQRLTNGEQSSLAITSSIGSNPPSSSSYGQQQLLVGSLPGNNNKLGQTRQQLPTSHHHHHHNFKSHQRRQSVVRLLPDISKLRLLSWLVEASSELINCDVAIMDGVYAKLNRSQESLLFWNNTSAANQNQNPSYNNNRPVRRPPPPMPSVQPVANRIVISRGQQQQRPRSGRNHHSLPLTNYDASSLAAVSLSSSLGPTSRTSRSIDAEPLVSSSSNQRAQAGSNAGGNKQQQIGNVCSTSNANAADSSILCDNSNTNDDFCDSNQSDDDDNSSAASSTTSSGIHGGGTSSISSTTSTSSSSNCSVAPSLSSSSAASVASESQHQVANQQVAARETCLSSAELLSEKIRCTVMRHNHLQSLLVNIIRQYDRQRDSLNEQRLRQISSQTDQFSGSSLSANSLQIRSYQLDRIDLTEISEALNDGCLCSCHNSRLSRRNRKVNDDSKAARSSTLPITSSSVSASTSTRQQQRNSVAGNNQVPLSRKVRRFKKTRGNNSDELNKEDLINLLADKLCENCFETHYWLHGDCSLIDLPQVKSSSNSTRQDNSSSLSQDFFAIISKRNSTFIKLVQQEVRSTISKSIELIDLIRKEFKSPESIKQKQLMRCFSSSIQLLSSVGNYVVPAQDISSFIPEAIGHQANLFCLPSSDFDHLLFYPQVSVNSIHNQQQQQPQQNYHLASAPEIPIRRRNKQHLGFAKTRSSDINGSSSLMTTTCSVQVEKGNEAVNNSSSVENGAKTSSADSSSGASSNNSSASSSIARGTVQQSSLTRVHTSNAILDGKNRHDLSFEAIANLSRQQQQQTEDDMLFQSRPKFWQSSKFNFIKKLLHVKQQRLLRQQSKDRRIYNNKVQNKFRLVMMDLTHFNKSQQLLATENGVNSLLTSMRNVLEFGLYLTLKLY